MNPGVSRAAQVFALVFMSGCHKTAPPAVDEAAAPLPVDAANVDAGEPSPRCSVTATSNLSADLEVGQGLLLSNRALLGVVRTREQKRFASILWFSRSAQGGTFVDVGEVPAAASSPTLFARSDEEVFAASCVLPLSTGNEVQKPKGRWTVFRIGQLAEPLAVLPESIDCELPTLSAVALPSGSPYGAVLAWDESVKPSPEVLHAVDAGEEPLRGAVRLAFLSPDMHAVARVEAVSPASSNAERPEVISRDGGLWVAWIARQAETTREPALELERPGEDRAYRWVELVALDAQGKPAGSVRRLTPFLGHVSGFEMVGSAGSRVDVYVEVDDERTQGVGGSIAHVIAGLDAAPRSVPTVPEGRERGTASCLSGWPALPSLLLYVDSTDHVRALDLDSDGQPRGRSSLEMALDGARLLVAGPSTGTAGGTDVVTSAPSSGDAQPNGLRWFSCEARR
jgi:hypothetical protein